MKYVKVTEEARDFRRWVYSAIYIVDISFFILTGHPNEWPDRAATNNSGMPFLYKYIALEWQK